MNQYEFVFLLKEKKEVKKIEELLSSLKAEILRKEEWGEKFLAYPIKKQSSALFFIWQINLSPAKLSGLKKNLNFNNNVLRYLFLKTNKEIKPKSKRTAKGLKSS